MSADLHPAFGEILAAHGMPQQLDTPEQRAAIAALVARWRTEGYRAKYAGSRRFATLDEAVAASQGFDDYPLFIGPDSASYRIGWHDADRNAQMTQDDNAERTQQ